MTSLFQMLWDVIAGGGEMIRWRMIGDGGMSVPDLIVKLTKVSVVKFSPIKTLILNLSPTNRETSRFNFHFQYQKIKKIMSPKSHFYLLYNFKNIICKKKFLQMRNLQNIYISELLFTSNFCCLVNKQEDLL